MNTHLLLRSVLLLIACGCLLSTGTLVAGEKLKVFILAGQSNMVGHANPHTMATLYQSGIARDAELARMVPRRQLWKLR